MDIIMKSLFSYNSSFWQFSERLLHYLWMSVLWLLCSIPIFTIGASTAALYTVTLSYVKHQEGYITSSFFQAFKSNLKQGTAIWCLSCIAGFFLSAGMIVYFRQQNTSVLYFLLMTLFISLLVAFLLACLFVYPLMAIFENSAGRTIVNAFITALTHPFSGIAMLSISFLIIAAGFLLFPPLLFFCPALIACIHSRFINKIFDKYLLAQNIPE